MVSSSVFFQMICPQASHLSHRPSVRTRLSASAVPSTPGFCRANQAINTFLSYQLNDLNCTIRALEKALFDLNRRVFQAGFPDEGGEAALPGKSHFKVKVQRRFVFGGHGEADGAAAVVRELFH